MKRLCLAAFVAIAVLTGCKKADKFSNLSEAPQTKSSKKEVSVINGRLVFSNEAAIVKFGETYANLPDSSLDSLEKTLGYISLRRTIGVDFQDPSKTPVESNILGTVLNPDGLYQVGDSAFCVFKQDSTVKILMLSGVTDDGLAKLKAGTMTNQITDVTELDVYGSREKSTNENCGLCRFPQQIKHVDKSSFTYVWQGQTRYFKGFTKMDNIGALKSIFGQMRHFRGLDIMTPLPGSCRFFISGCAKYQYKIGSNCYTKSTDMYSPPVLWSGYGVSAHQVTYVITSKCLRNFYAETWYKGQYETSTSTTQTRDFGNFTWPRGLSGCY